MEAWNGRNGPARLGHSCNCGWEVKFGYGVAVTLAIFEAKRFLMLVLEMFAEWQVIRFAGGAQPVILSFVDVTVGLPSALIAVRTIRKRKVPRCRARTKYLLKYLLLIIATCVILNVATLGSIGYHITVRRETLIDAFNASMRLYVTAASYKYAVDEIQFIFQCCGHTSYVDWFVFDWQGVDYASRDEMAVQERVSDEEYRDRGVPFSCCSLRSMTPCAHASIVTDRDARTISAGGCAEIIGPVLVRIVVVAYVMTTTLLVTQALLAFLVTRMLDRLLPPRCMARCCRDQSSPSDVSASLRLIGEANSNGPVSRLNASRTRSRSSNQRSRFCATRRVVQGSTESTTTSASSSSGTAAPRPGFFSRAVATREAASIKPSVHEEHRISKMRLRDRRTR